MTVVALLKTLLAVGRPRRGGALSMTSSWAGGGGGGRSVRGGGGFADVTEGEEPGGAHGSAVAYLLEGLAPEVGDALHGLHQVGGLVPLAAAGLGGQGGGGGLHGRPRPGGG